jgi:hypothetical protein
MIGILVFGMVLLVMLIRYIHLTCLRVHMFCVSVTVPIVPCLSLMCML